MRKEKADSNINRLDSEFTSLVKAASARGSGTLTVTGSFVYDLRTAGPIVFDRSVTLCSAEGAELTLKGGIVTVGSVTVNGKLTLDNTTLIILGDLTGSGVIELMEESDVYVERGVNLEGIITGSGNLDVVGNVNVSGDIGNYLDISGNADTDDSDAVCGKRSP